MIHFKKHVEQLKSARWPLWVNLTVAFLVATFLMSFVSGILVRNLEMEYLLKRLEQQSHRTFSLFTAAAVDAVISEDQPVLESIVQQAVKFAPDIFSLRIENEKGFTLVSWKRQKRRSDDFLRFFNSNIVFKGETFGRIMISWNIEKAQKNIEQHVQNMRIITVTSLILLSLIIVLWINYLVVQPIKKIDGQLIHFAKGDLSIKTNLSASEELVRLSRSVNSLGEILNIKKNREDLLKSTKESLLISNRRLKEEIIERKQAEDSLKEAYKRAEQANQAKSEFLSTMSHELRTPLNAIIGFSEILQVKSFGPLNEKQLEYVGDISQSGQHLLSLISDILDLSKIEAGKMEIKMELFNLKELLKESTKMFAEKSLVHRIKLLLNLDNNIETINADKRMIKQIMFNLLSNAFKFTQDGGQVCIEARRNDKKEAVITVWDTGIGILKKDRNRVFQEFMQIEHGTTRTYGGTGLGLSLCKRMVEMHGGKIWFKSEGRNKGSRFSFSLPQISSEDGSVFL